jgi:microcystin-dependent protein
MGDWFIGEIRAFSFSWAPEYWALCDGTELQIQSNAALYAVLGTTFGGNGSTTFKLPDLRGRVLAGTNFTKQDYQPGKALGAETVTLTAAQIPPHNHSLQVIKEAGTAAIPTGNLISTAGSNTVVPTPPNLFAPPGTQMIPLNPGSVAAGSGATGHNNVQPSLVVNYCIARAGIFPPRA